MVPVEETLPVLTPLIVPEPEVVSSTAVRLPDRVPLILTSLIVPAPCARSVPLMLPETVIVSRAPPSIVPVEETLPVLTPLIVPEPALVSSTAVMLPDRLPLMLTSRTEAPPGGKEGRSRWPPYHLKKKAPPLMLPVEETLPVLTPLIVPEPALGSSTAVVLPDVLPLMLRSLIVPAPCARSVPFMTQKTAYERRWPLLMIPVEEPLPVLTPLIVPEPALVSSTAVMLPDRLPLMLTS